MTNGELGTTGQRIYDFIVGQRAATGLVPSVREIREAVGVSSIGTVGYWLDKLEAAKLISRDAGKNRSIQIEAESPTISVPLVGEIHAGAPVLAEERIEGRFPLPRQLVGEGDLFMLRVRGDSMIGAQIAEGDYVVVREQRDADSGDVVAALVPGIEDGATVKRLSRRDDGHVWLLPANDRYPPIPGDDATVLGRVVTVLRRI